MCFLAVRTYFPRGNDKSSRTATRSGLAVTRLVEICEGFSTLAAGFLFPPRIVALFVLGAPLSAPVVFQTQRLHRLGESLHVHASVFSLSRMSVFTFTRTTQTDCVRLQFIGSGETDQIAGRVERRLSVYEVIAA